MAENYYVEKVDGKIVALYAVPQEGVTETKPLSETHPDIVAFLSPPPPPKNKLRVPIILLSRYCVNIYLS